MPDVSGIATSRIIHHLAIFVSRLWQIHILLLNESHPLHNRTMHLSGTFKEAEKADIESEKADFDVLKADIENAFQPKTASHIVKLREAFPGQCLFGRSDVMRAIGIQASRASALIKEMAERGIVEPVTGQGKGKYRFRTREIKR